MVFSLNLHLRSSPNVEYGRGPNFNLLKVLSASHETEVMETANGLVIWWILLHHCFWSCISTDTITIDKPIRDGELLVSKEQKFALGFFSPGKSTNRYVGIWYNNLPEQTVVWVANRDQPINDTSGILSINHEGNLVLHHSYRTFPIWSTNVTLTLSNTTVIAQLSDIANLVLIQNNTKTIIWQSFDHLTDTILPYSKMGFDRRTHQRWFLQSWKSDDDPGSGTFTHNFTSSGKAQVFLFKQNHKWWRGGSFNGEIFVGIPFMKRAMITTFNYTIVDDDDEVYFMFNTFDDSVIARLMVHQSGFLQLFTWDSQKIQWKRYWSAPETECDDYGTCGSNSNCNPLNYEDFQCSCLPGFEPRNPNDWYQNRDASGGCIRKNEKSICGNGEGFVKVEGVKIPDTSIAIEEKSWSLEECEKECLKNCSCMAYAAANVRNAGSGCLAWYGTLMDTQKLSDGGHDLYIRVDSIELENYARKSGGILTKKGLLAIPIASFAAITILIAFYVFKRKREDRMRYLNQDSPSEEEHGQSRTHIKLPFFGIKTVVAATNNFASENELGQGGFGIVYKGQLINGQEIAVKRLSKGSGQGTQEFKNEVKLIAKLQHRNLVRLLGCCIHKKERMLIYEYLPNKSLDFFIFDITQKSSLLWDKRFEIILGIARGILYLHQDSRLKIIHRDLKASNILLDAAMNPKISDFGMARIFREDQIQAITRRIVGTYGYMAPEYAMEGEYSTKSDVFSFGVLLLEIISGKRNTDRKQRGGASLNLIGHVWNLHRERRATDIVDSTLGQSFPASIVLRCIIIGLLCVQESPMNRPSMLQVVFMLGNETTLPSPRKPAFLFNGNEDHPESSGSSVNEVTFTTISAR